MNTEIREVVPIQVWTSAMMNYSAEVVEDYVANAWSNLCRDDEGKLQPHVSVLYFDGRGVELFKSGRQDHGTWTLKVYVFASNKDMEDWIEDFGANRILHECYA